MFFLFRFAYVFYYKNMFLPECDVDEYETDSDEARARVHEQDAERGEYGYEEADRVE